MNGQQDKRVQFYFCNSFDMMGEMRFVVFSVFVFFFVAAPLYLLSALIMPQLTSLQNTYAHADALAEQLAAGK